MTDHEREPQDPQPIDESTYAGSSAETGGLYQDEGPTTTNQAGDTMSLREEEESPDPESHTDG